MAVKTKGEKLSQAEMEGLVERAVLAGVGVIERLHQWLEGERALVVGPFRIAWMDAGKPSASVIGTKPPAHQD